MGKHMLMTIWIYLDLFGSIWIFGVPPTGIPFFSDLHVWKLHQHRGSNWRAKFRGTARKMVLFHVLKKNQELSFQHSLNVSYT
jgi:hypothetical protein